MEKQQWQAKCSWAREKETIAGVAVGFAQSQFCRDAAIRRDK